MKATTKPITSKVPVSLGFAGGAEPVLLCVFGVLGVLGLSPAGRAAAQVDYDRPPINYSQATSQDAVADLQQQLDNGTRKLEYDQQHGYLPSLLTTLGISPVSQLLVFSKTSFQQSRITPRRPRALYFNDHTYVGWVQQGDVLEVSTVDPQLGAVFYTLSQQEAAHPQFERQTHQCLTCHGATHTGGVPGHFVRSVFPDRSGRPVLSAGSFRTDYTSPLSERWGGWYVSGRHGAQRHMGNVTIARASEPETLDVQAGANVEDLSSLELLDVAPYLTGHSDLVALMVLEHQVAVHNALTAAHYSARITMRDAQIMNEALGRESGFESESTRRRLDSAAERLVRTLLLSGEHALAGPVAGTSGFAESFIRLGPFDDQGAACATWT